MSFDLAEFARKLRSYRDQRQLTPTELANGTGIPIERCERLEAGEVLPTGDEVLIIADFFQCDYRFFISNEKLAAFQQTETLYRKFSKDFTKNDRRSIQEFLFLCESEAFLLTELNRKTEPFSFSPTGSYYKGHGEDAATALRRHFSYRPNQVPSDVYADFRRLGFHVFRRRLENSDISGLTIQHPTAGTCILVNYSEDVYRQRFTAAHEGGHGILDRGDDVIVTFKGQEREYVEIRANTFASRYLLPREVVTQIPVQTWNHGEIVKRAGQFRVSTHALAIALKEFGIIDDRAVNHLRQARVPAHQKIDPELANLPERVVARKESLLQRGLSNFYVNLCLEAWSRRIISGGRAAEMLLVDDSELEEIGELFGVRVPVH